MPLQSRWTNQRFGVRPAVRCLQSPRRRTLRFAAELSRLVSILNRWAEDRDNHLAPGLERHRDGHPDCK